MTAPDLLSRRAWIVTASLAGCASLAKLPEKAAKQISRTPLEPDSLLLDKISAWKELGAATRSVLQLFLESYPGTLFSVSLLPDGRIFAGLVGGTHALVEDGQENETFEELLAAPDLADTLHDRYPRDLKRDSWPTNFDPGRFRNQELLKAVYGTTEQRVRTQLETVNFVGHKVPMHRKRAAAALRGVANDLEALLKKNAGLRPHLSKLGGGFNWRKIAGTDRLSSHSFGIAIDLNPDLGGYWRWSKKADRSDMKRRRDYPAAIVEIFERHHFIWGGKWDHFDLMHFEYRPEFFHSSLAATPRPGSP